MNHDDLLALILIPSLYSLFVFRSTVISLFQLGKSKTRLKKEKSTIPLKDRVFLCKYVEECKKYQALAKKSRALYLAEIGLLFVFLILWFISLWINSFLHILQYSVLGKCFFLDLPATLFFFFMTKHGKSGGCVWRWEE